MELKWLEDFVSLSDWRNFSKAALARHTTQPAFSRRIKALELWYGVPLVDRSTYPITLTSAGVLFLPTAHQIVTAIYRSRREARADSGVSGRTVTFAMPHALAVCFYPAWWRRQKRHIDTRATVIAADFDDCVELLRNGASQYLLCYTHSEFPNGLDEHGMQRSKIGSDCLVPVSAVDAQGRPIFDLLPHSNATVPLLAYTQMSFFGRVTSGVHAKLGGQYRFKLRYESALVEALKAEAIVGEGIAWLPKEMIKSELTSGTLKVIGDALSTIPLEIWLFRPSAATRSTDVMDFGLLMEDRSVSRSLDESVSHPRGDFAGSSTNE
jgi:DNA-binding transcriptional LysR family regulator